MKSKGALSAAELDRMDYLQRKKTHTRREVSELLALGKRQLAPINEASMRELEAATAGEPRPERPPGFWADDGRFVEFAGGSAVGAAVATATAHLPDGKVLGTELREFEIALTDSELGHLAVRAVGARRHLSSLLEQNARARREMTATEVAARQAATALEAAVGRGSEIRKLTCSWVVTPDGVARLVRGDTGAQIEERPADLDELARAAK